MRTLVLPPPADGVTYAASEVAAIAGVRIATVRDWVARGFSRSGETVQLRSLRVPRGRFAPVDVCGFLATVNGMTVEVAREGRFPVSLEQHASSI